MHTARPDHLGPVEGRFRLGLTPVTVQALAGTDLAGTAQDRAIPDTEISL